MCKLLSSYRICIRGFINWHFRQIILSPATYLTFQKGNIMVCNFTARAISIHSTSWNSLGCTSIIGRWSDRYGIKGITVISSVQMEHYIVRICLAIVIVLILFVLVINMIKCSHRISFCLIHFKNLS